MISGRDIIHFSLDDYWRSDPHSRHHLTYQFLKNNNRVLWVNSFGMRIPDLRRSGNIRRVTSKLKSYAKILKSVDEKFWVFSPIAVPALKGSVTKVINDFSLLSQIRMILRILKVKNPVLFVTSPMFPEVIKRIKKNFVIYYYSDKYVSYREITQREKVLELDGKTLALAQYVFCASKEIHDEVSKRHNNVYYLPHAVDFDRFHSVLNTETVLPKDMEKIKKPIVGYFGSLSDSNDIDLIRYLAVSRPQYSIVLIGQPSIKYAELSSFPNIHLLGRKNYREIPLYGKYFDVCFMAWKSTEWIKNSSPLKTMEYLALGKPVVSIPINELISNYGGLVDIAYEQKDFLDKIDYNLNYDSPEKREQRISFAMHHTWEKRFAEMINIIEQKSE